MFIYAILRQNLSINKTLTVICSHLSSHNEITVINYLSPKQIHRLFFLRKYKHILVQPKLN